MSVVGRLKEAGFSLLVSAIGGILCASLIAVARILLAEHVGLPLYSAPIPLVAGFLAFLVALFVNPLTKVHWALSGAMLGLASQTSAFFPYDTSSLPPWSWGMLLALPGALLGTALSKGRGSAKSRQRGFTLVELLVVMGIIAVLVAIIFPVFSKAREMARRARCASNLRQIAMAFRMYVQDWDGCFPVPNVYRSPDDGCGERYEGHFEWLPGLLTVADQLDPYVKNSSVWVCPSDGRDVYPPGQYRAGKPWTSYHYRHYFCIGFHWNCPTEAARWAAWHVPREAEFQNPAGVFSFHEVSLFHFRGEVEGRRWKPNAKMNFAFLDGHVKAVPVGKILMPSKVVEWGWDYHWPRNGWEVWPVVGKPDL